MLHRRSLRSFTHKRLRKPPGHGATRNPCPFLVLLVLISWPNRRYNWHLPHREDLQAASQLRIRLVCGLQRLMILLLHREA